MEDHKFTVLIESFTEMDMEIELVTQYEFEGATGDGWNEPHYDDSVTIYGFEPVNKKDGLAIMLAGRYTALLEQSKMDFSHLEDEILQTLISDYKADMADHLLDIRRDSAMGF